MTYQKCEYRTVCQQYIQDSLCCTVSPLFHLCPFHVRLDRKEARLEEEKKIKRIKESELFELSQENKGMEGYKDGLL